MRATCQESYSDVIRKIDVDLRSRDDIPALIRGLQHIYMDYHLRMLVGTGLDLLTHSNGH